MDLGADDLDVEGRHGGDEFSERGIVFADADDGAAGAGEFGADADGAGGFDHADVAGVERAETAAEIEVFVEEGADAAGAVGEEHEFDLFCEIGPALDGGADLLIAAVVARAHVVVEDLGAFGEVGGVGDVEWREKRGVEGFVEAVAETVHEGGVEVHEDDAFVDLNDAVLEPGGDIEFDFFGGEDEGRERVERDLDVVEAHEGAEAGGDDGGRACEADVVGDVAAVGEAEVACWEGDAFGFAVVGEDLAGGFEESDPAVVAEAVDVVAELGETEETGVVAIVGDDFDDWVFLDGDASGEVADDEGDGFTVVTVGGIADETGAGVGEVFDCGHGKGVVVRGLGREARRQWGEGLGLRRVGGGAYCRREVPAAERC